MNPISMILVVLVAVLAGMESVLDQFQFHQPLVACTLIGLFTGNLQAGIMLGGSLQLIALGWSNVGAAIAPDAAFASTASAVLLVLGGQGAAGVPAAIAAAIPLAVAGLFLTMIARTLSIPVVHAMDRAAEKGNIAQLEMWQYIGMLLQGARVAIPVAMLMFIPASAVQGALESMPEWLNAGMAIGGGMVVAVGYALVINLMATREVWPFFILGFVVAALTEITLIGLGGLGVALALIYLQLSKMGGSGNGGGGHGDPLGDILNDY